MAQIITPNIDEAVIEALERRAAAGGTSIQEQARRILTRAAGLDRDKAMQRLAEIRQSIGRVGDRTITDDLRGDRDRDSAG
jgi:plasmid stability protein